MALNQIRSLRRSRNLTLEQLADRTGVSKTTISELERHREGAKIAHLRALADTFGLTIDELLKPQ